jgi:methyl-accepting chemotaxis protein
MNDFFFIGKLRIGTKILLINCIIMLIVAGLLVHLTTTIKNINHIIETQNQNLLRLENVHQATQSFQKMRYWISDLEVSWLNESEKKANRYHQELKQLLPLIYKEDQFLLKTILKNLEEFNTINLDAVDAYVDENRVKGNSLVSKGRKIASKIDAKLNTLLDSAKLAAKQAGRDVTASNSGLVNVSYSLLSIAIIVGFGLSYLLSNMISRPMRDANQAIANMATGAGDLTQRLKISSRDEIGQFSGEFNKFVQKIQHIIGGAVNSVEQLSATADQLNVVTRSNQEHVEQQQMETTQMAAAITQMAQTSTEVARNAAETASAIKTARDEATKGHQVVRDTISAMVTLEDTMGSSTVKIETLAAGTEKICQLLADIATISEQTNLLALNAAIESARAGEHGRGFSVVADEVRLLAQRTQGVTDNIKQMIDEIQVSVNEAVSSMQNGLLSTRETGQLAENTGTVLQVINEMLDNITDRSHQIASAAEEQSATAEEVSRNIENLSDITDQSLHCAEQTAESGNKVASLSGKLGEAVGQFTV